MAKCSDLRRGTLRSGLSTIIGFQFTHRPNCRDASILIRPRSHACYAIYSCWMSAAIPLRFKYRLAGTEFSRLTGRDLTGRYIDEVHPGFNDLILRQYTNAAELGRPAYRKGAIPYARPDKHGMERLIVPLARNGVDVDMILGIAVYISARWLIW